MPCASVSRRRWRRRENGGSLTIAYSSCAAGAISEEEYVDGWRGAGFEDVEVQARQAYNASQLRSCFKCGLLQAGEATARCSSAADSEAAIELAGKIWSAKFHARKLDGDSQADRRLRVALLHVVWYVAGEVALDGRRGVASPAVRDTDVDQEPKGHCL